MNKKIEKIILADQDRTVELETYIDTVLEALGHPEALVTDESEIYHFMDIFYDKDGRRAEIDKVENILGISINEDDLIVDVAQRLKERMVKNGKS